MVKIVDRQIVTLTAKANVVFAPVDEEFRKDPSRMLRKALRCIEPKVTFKIFEEGNNMEPVKPAGVDIYEQFEMFAAGSGAGQTEESA